MSLRHRDLLPTGVEEHLEVKPVQAQPGCTTTIVTSIIPAKPTPPVDDRGPHRLAEIPVRLPRVRGRLAEVSGKQSRS